MVVEPTRSQNMTVRCRRSAESSESLLGGSGEGCCPVRSEDNGRASAAIAASSLRRCPTLVTPSSLRSSPVSCGRTSASTALSRNAVSYYPRPRLLSQAATSTVASTERDGLLACVLYLQTSTNSGHGSNGELMSVSGATDAPAQDRVPRLPPVRGAALEGRQRVRPHPLATPSANDRYLRF